MKIKQITETSTTAGSIAPVQGVLGSTQTRGNPSIYGGKKVGNLFKGKTTSKPYANSLNEAAMKDLSYDLEVMKPAEFQKKYGKSREEVKAALSRQPKPAQPTTPPINEADLSEHDLIMVPGQGKKLKPGFISKADDRTDREVEMARSDLFQSAKNAKKVYSMIKDVGEDEGLEGWVQEKIIKANDYLNTVREYLEGKEVQGMNEGSQQVDSLVTDSLKIMRGPEVNDAVRALKTVLGNREYNGRRGFYNFYVKQILDMYGQQGATESLGTTGAMTNGEMGESQLDELSPQTLGSYVKSASGDMANRKGNTQFHKGARVATSAFTSKQSPGRFEKDDKIEKRQDGINRAVNKITGKN